MINVKGKKLWYYGTIIIILYLLVPFGVVIQPPSKAMVLHHPLHQSRFHDLFLSSIPISSLKPGDIAFKHPEAFKGPIIIDHCLLCTDYNASNNTYEFIEAHYHYGVHVRYETIETITGLSWGPYVRVRNANETQIQNAIAFMKQQVGKKFQNAWINKNYNPTDTENDSLANEWYCSELVWAAYYNCNNPFPDGVDEEAYLYGDGIDIDFNAWNPIFHYVIVAPRDIIFDNNVRRILLSAPASLIFE